MIVIFSFVMRGLDPRIHVEFPIGDEVHGLPGQARQ
jgi:hypothetical protein